MWTIPSSYSKMYFLVIYLFSLISALQAQSFSSSIPSIVQPQFEAAWNAMREMSSEGNSLRSADISIEDIDIHSIPYGKEILCKVCNLTFDFLITSHNYYVPDQVLKIALTRLCSLIYTEAVCQGIIELNVPIFFEIAKRKPDLNSYHVCGTIFEHYCANSPVVEWSINIPEKKEYLKKQESTVWRKKRVDGSTEETIAIAHVSDTHVDVKYAAGSKGSGCREPICCRGYQGEAAAEGEAAGPWGNYRSCDIPSATADNAFAAVAASHKNIKYVYMTGDLIAHNIWETSQEENTKQIQEQAKSFYEIFGGTKIFPVLGNHEPHPANVLVPPEKNIPEYSADWLYEVFYDSWCKHFPPETRTTFMRGGFYSVSPEPGFRVVGLNSLFGYVYNWWMILDPVDPAGQLAWLSDVLLVAERNGEKVHILMHGPSSESDTLRVWSREYHRLIDRFQDTVAGQFVGHTHRDQFYLFYNQETSSEPFSVAWNGGSVTTFTNANPNYKVYFVNKQTMEVEDVDTYIYNLTEANLNQDVPPQWFKLYSFKDEYDLPSLQLQDMNNLVKKLSANRQVFRNYFLYYLKNSDIAYRKTCSSSCQQKQLCKIVATNNSTLCKQILLNNSDSKT